MSTLEPPSIPNNITILELGSRTIVLSWEDGISPTPGNPPANTYQILLNNSLVITVSNTLVTLEGLLPFTNYNVTIVAENRIGISDNSEPVFFMTAEEGKVIIRAGNILTIYSYHNIALILVRILNTKMLYLINISVFIHVFKYFMGYNLKYNCCCIWHGINFNVTKI